jgi:hypothetical protein
VSRNMVQSGREVLLAQGFEVGLSGGIELQGEDGDHL